MGRRTRRPEIEDDDDAPLSVVVLGATLGIGAVVALGFCYLLFVSPTENGYLLAGVEIYSIRNKYGDPGPINVVFCPLVALVLVAIAAVGWFMRPED